MADIAQFPTDGDAAALALSARLTDADSVQDIIERLRLDARRALGADGVCIVLRDGDYVDYVAENAISPLFTGQRFPLGSCISGLAMRDCSTIVIPDIRTDPRPPRAAYEPTFVRSMALAPIGEPQPFAALGAYWSKVGAPTAEVVERLQRIARAASQAWSARA